MNTRSENKIYTNPSKGTLVTARANKSTKSRRKKSLRSEKLSWKHWHFCRLATRHCHHPMASCEMYDEYVSACASALTLHCHTMPEVISFVPTEIFSRHNVVVNAIHKQTRDRERIKPNHCEHEFYGKFSRSSFLCATNRKWFCHFTNVYDLFVENTLTLFRLWSTKICSRWRNWMFATLKYGFYSVFSSLFLHHRNEEKKQVKMSRR